MSFRSLCLTDFGRPTLVFTSFVDFWRENIRRRLNVEFFWDRFWDQGSSQRTSLCLSNWTFSLLMLASLLSVTSSI